MTSEMMLLPSTLAPGPKLTLVEFCTAYELTDLVRERLDANGYTGSNLLPYIELTELKDMGFKPGEIAALKEAVRSWALPNASALIN